MKAVRGMRSQIRCWERIPVFASKREMTDCQRDLDRRPPLPFPITVTVFSFFQAVRHDFQAICDRDPAARNPWEIWLCYPGLHALILHRIAHCGRHLPLFPRLLSHLGRFLTGIEIHPDANLGVGICIDHGNGVVIGETTRIGDGATLYQGVTLGGTGNTADRRHPQLGRNVTVGAGAVVLGNLNIGDNVRIGAGAVVVGDVPANSTVVGIPGRVVRHSGQPTTDDNLDRFDETISDLHQRLDRLECHIRQLQSQPHNRLQPEEHREQTLAC